MDVSNKLCVQRIIWNRPETENSERQKEKRHNAGDRLREEGCGLVEREKVFPNPINLGVF
jgi:hypothetical protein